MIYLDGWRDWKGEEIFSVANVWGIYTLYYGSNTVAYLPANVLVLIVDLFILAILRICIYGDMRIEDWMQNDCCIRSKNCYIKHKYSPWTNAKLRVKKSVSTVYIFILCFIEFKFLMKVNEIKIKKGVDLAQHLVDFYDAQVTWVLSIIVFPLSKKTRTLRKLELHTTAVND